MRSLRKNKQLMYYSVCSDSSVVYELDSNGNIVYTNVDGELVPVEIGSMDTEYSTPVQFYGTITSDLNEIQVRSYGVDQSAISSKLIIPKNYLPELKIGALIWRESEIVYKDQAETIPLDSSADYIVMGILNEYKSFDEYVLQRVSDKEGVVNG